MSKLYVSVNVHFTAEHVAAVRPGIGTTSSVEIEPPEGSHPFVTLFARDDNALIALRDAIDAFLEERSA